MNPTPASGPAPGAGVPRGTGGVPTYYDEPAIKASHYGWMVAGYVFLAGLAGAAQVLAALAMLVPGDPRAAKLVGDARYVALAATLVGAILLVADLQTPKRWANMLRILRWTSPMSIGSWVLVGFGAATLLTVWVQAFEDLGLLGGFPRILALLLQWTAALLGMLMCTYTAPLLSSTSTPLWAASPNLLAASQAGFALASGASVLTLTRLAADSASRHPALTPIALLAAASALVLTLLWIARIAARRLAAPLREGRIATALGLGVFAVGLLLPIGLYATTLLGGGAGGGGSGGGGFAATPSSLRSAIAAAAGLTGSLLWRWVVIAAGNASANRPEDYFRFTGSQPGNRPAKTAARIATLTPPAGEAARAGKHAERPSPDSRAARLRRSVTAIVIVSAALLSLALAGTVAFRLVVAEGNPDRSARTHVDGGDMQRGQRIMTQYQCGACHRIPEVPAAHGTIGPTLEKFGLRSFIAGEIPNRPDVLVRWIVEPRALIPDTTMPSVGASVQDARDMAAYLMSLQ